jgi:hypothetical protein
VKKVASNDSVSGIDGGLHVPQSFNLHHSIKEYAPSLRVSCLLYKQAKLLNNLLGCTIQGNQPGQDLFNIDFWNQEVLAIRRKKHPLE